MIDVATRVTIGPVRPAGGLQSRRQPRLFRAALADGSQRPLFLEMRHRIRRPKSGSKLPHSQSALRLHKAFDIGWLVLIAALVFAGPRAKAQELTETQAGRAKSLGLKVKCMCGGCNDPAGACFHSGGAFSGPCDMARSEIKMIDERVAKGESDDQILKDFVAQYGPTVLVDPPKAGFDLTAWIMPVLVPVLGLFGVWEIARRWRQKHPAATAPANASGISPEMIARVQHDIEKDEP